MVWIQDGILIIYFILLAMASYEDYCYHRVRGWWQLSIALLGILRLIFMKNDRWVTLALTCVCFLLLYAFYRIVAYCSGRLGSSWKLGGADVRMIAGMMLVQGWDVALTGILIGCLVLLVCKGWKRKKSDEIPLIPWMSLGCLIVELF